MVENIVTTSNKLWKIPYTHKLFIIFNQIKITRPTDRQQVSVFN